MENTSCGTAAVDYLREVQAAAQAIGQRLIIVKARQSGHAADILRGPELTLPRP
jgi:hypothetical protein